MGIDEEIGKDNENEGEAAEEGAGVFVGVDEDACEDEAEEGEVTIEGPRVFLV